MMGDFSNYSAYSRKVRFLLIFQDCCCQHLGPAAEKARSPNRVFIHLTRRSHLSVDRSHSPEADECVSLQ